MYPELPALARGIVLPEVPLLPVVALPHRRPHRSRECKVCMGEHDQATHDATRSVHDWFRYEVTKNLEY